MGKMGPPSRSIQWRDEYDKCPDGGTKPPFLHASHAYVHLLVVLKYIQPGSLAEQPVGRHPYR